MQLILISISIKISHDNSTDKKYSTLFAPGMANTPEQAQIENLSNAFDKGVL